jgi:hypothetical protein
MDRYFYRLSVIRHYIRLKFDRLRYFNLIEKHKLFLCVMLISANLSKNMNSFHVHDVSLYHN